MYLKLLSPSYSALPFCLAMILQTFSVLSSEIPLALIHSVPCLWSSSSSITSWQISALPIAVISTTLLAPVYNPLFHWIFCRAADSQLVPCLWPTFPQFGLLILSSSPTCKMGFGCVGFFSFLECVFPDFTKLLAPKPSQKNSVFFGFALSLFFEDMGVCM